MIDSRGKEGHFQNEEEKVIKVNIEISIRNGGINDDVSFYYDGNGNNKNDNNNDMLAANKIFYPKNNMFITKQQLLPLIKCVNDLAASVSQNKKLDGGKLIFANGDKACIRRMNVTYSDRMNINHDITSSGNVVCLPIGAKNIEVKFYVIGGSKIYRTERDKKGQPWYRDKNKRCQEEIIIFEYGDGLDALFILKGTSLHCYVHKAWDFGRPVETPKRNWEWWGGCVPNSSSRDELI